MRKWLILPAAMLLFLAACGPSEEKRKDASFVYDGTLKLVKSVNNHDSEYVFCMQYLMREIQAPDLKKNKNKLKNLNDSIGMLDALTDSLLLIVSNARIEISDLKADKPGFEILESADSLLSKYDQVATKVYTEINRQMKEVSLPVKDSEYTGLLKLSYRADSVLNAAITDFNSQGASFFDKFGLKEYRK